MATDDPSPLITDEYRRMQADLHKDPLYGVASVDHAPLVAQVIEQTGATELLDYGAGKGRLAEALLGLIKRPITIHRYDPAIPKLSTPPQPCGLVVCIDVLEHVEPDRLDSVLDELEYVTHGVGVFTVHTHPANKVLPDGRNAHLILEPPSWWLPRIMERFELVQFRRVKKGFWVIVERLKG